MVQGPQPRYQLEKGESWRSDYCKACCLRKDRRLEFITKEELLAEDRYNIFVIGIALFTDEHRDNIKVKILPQYQDFADIFSWEEVNALPEYTKYDHCIDLMPDAKLPDGPIYPLSRKELDTLMDYFKEMEDHGKIRKSGPCQ